MSVSITVRHAGGIANLRAEAGTPLAPLLRETGLLTLPSAQGSVAARMRHLPHLPTPQGRHLKTSR